MSGDVVDDPCPICKGTATRRDGRGPLASGLAMLLDATCDSCGWHFTTREAKRAADFASRRAVARTRKD